MPRIYIRSTGAPINVNIETFDRLNNNGEISVNGETNYVIQNPRPTSIPVSNTAESEFTNHMTTSRRVRFSNSRTVINGNSPIGHVEPIQEELPESQDLIHGEGIESQITSGDGTLLNNASVRAAFERIASSSYSYSTPSYDWIDIYKVPIAKEDKTKYGADLTKVINTIDSFIKNIDERLDVNIITDSIFINVDTNSKIVRYLQKNPDKKVFEIVKNTRMYWHPRYLSNLDRIKAVCLIKIKSCDESVRLFRNKSIKKQMMESGENFIINNFILNYECKEDGITRDIVEITSPNGKKNIKFAITDLEFLLPDTSLLLQGYNKPKDRTIKKGSEVKLIDNRKTGLPKSSKLKVTADFTDKTGSKKYYTVEYNNKEYVIAKNKLRVV